MNRVQFDRNRARQVARALVFNEKAELLLLKYDAESQAMAVDHYWVPPGGGVDAEEEPRTAGRRELYEETGIVLNERGIHVWTRDTVFSARRTSIHQTEFYYFFGVRTSSGVVLQREGEAIAGSKWWSIDELTTSDAVFFPAALPALVSSLCTDGVPAHPLQIEEV